MALLETKQLSVHFGGVVAVDRLDMAIEPGEILGLIGPNGAGKTTTLNLLSGYLLPSHGRLHFKGQDITGLQPHGSVPQAGEDSRSPRVRGCDRA